MSLKHTALLLAFVTTTLLHAQKTLTNQEIWASPTFGAEGVGGLASMKDGLHYTVLGRQKDGTAAIFKCAYATGDTVATLLTAKDLVLPGADKSLEMDGYSFSADEKQLLIETESEAIYRYSYTARHYVYELATKKLRALSDTTGSAQRLATFSPDGQKAAFVRDNDLYIVELDGMKETRVTQDGKWNEVINGATDWVYEEEFTLVRGYEWSPNSTRLLYLRSDESRVKEFNLTYYRGQLYPEDYRFKYPKAGEENSQVSLYVFDLRNGTTTQVPLGDDLAEPYIPRLGWTTNDDVLWFMRMNRLQNEKVIYTVNVPLLRPAQLGLKAKPIFRDTSRTYVEVTDDLFFLPDGSGFVLTSERNGWNHVYWCSMDGRVQRPVTAGNYDVIGVKGVDARNKRVLFSAALKDPKHQEVWSLGLNGKNLVQLSPAGGVNNAEFSEGFRYFINTRSTLDSPPVVTLHDGNGKLIRTLKDNAKLKARLPEFGIRPYEFFQCEVSPGVTLNGWMLKPVNFDSRAKYPVWMTQYSGPNSNEVLDQWEGRNGLWFQLLAQKGYVVVCVDPRGTGHRGRDWRHVTYGQLGRYETEDMIGAAKWLQGQPWVDGERIGIWGWSYGGYMSSLCITKGADVFKAAIAVAPVSNWRFYDTIYTERYMGLPKDNASGYDDNSPINHVEKLKGKYLIVHGLADDNVHYQNAAEMVNSLVRRNKPFEQFMYPDRNHGIYGGATRLHLFEMMTKFIEENL
ncbi:MAG: S9 family peptidase [Flavobacteriales bacterium]|nr:S9 family peptidase [Flavobacteriales bacterium]